VVDLTALTGACKACYCFFLLNMCVWQGSNGLCSKYFEAHPQLHNTSTLCMCNIGLQTQLHPLSKLLGQVNLLNAQNSLIQPEQNPEHDQQQ